MGQKTKKKPVTTQYTIWVEDDEGNIFAAKETHSGTASEGIAQIQRLVDRGGYDEVIVDIWARNKK
jgi:hypothetical protein